MKNKEGKPYNSVNLPHGSIISGRPDFRTMAKCEAKAKSTGQRCKNVAMRGKRVCYLHGGKSTGAKTPEGKRRSKYARLQHGDYSAQVKQNRRKLMWINRISKWKGFLQQECRVKTFRQKIQDGNTLGQKYFTTNTCAREPYKALQKPNGNHIKTVINRDKTANIADSRAVSKGRKVRRLNPKTLMKYNYYGVNAN